MSLFIVSNLFNKKGSRHEVTAIEECSGFAALIIQTGNHGDPKFAQIAASVPLSALAELSDAVMRAERQLRPVDVSFDGFERMKGEYEKGPSRWREFVKSHTL
ncbi:MAG TPA: hypothetical protein DEA55_07055 [Rhodospirillaceae bacterium]|nr:hypothetical protein [Rhodospirillaceae bacterium]